MSDQSTIPAVFHRIQAARGFLQCRLGVVARSAGTQTAATGGGRYGLPRNGGVDGGRPTTECDR